MATNEEILRQLAELRAENERLRQQVREGNGPQRVVQPTTTHIDMWKGHPIIRFSGAFKPFGIGLKKAAIILEKIDDVRFFVENNRQHLAQAPEEDDQPG